MFLVVSLFDGHCSEAMQKRPPASGTGGEDGAPLKRATTLPYHQPIDLQQENGDYDAPFPCTRVGTVAGIPLLRSKRVPTGVMSKSSAAREPEMVHHDTKSQVLSKMLPKKMSRKTFVADDDGQEVMGLIFLELLYPTMGEIQDALIGNPYLLELTITGPILRNRQCPAILPGIIIEHPSLKKITFSQCPGLQKICLITPDLTEFNTPGCDDLRDVFSPIELVGCPQLMAMSDGEMPSFCVGFSSKKHKILRKH